MKELHKIGLSDCDIEFEKQVRKFHFDEVEKLLKQGADPLKNMTDEEDEYDDCVTRIYREVQFMYSEITDEVLGQRMILGEERDFNDLIGKYAAEYKAHDVKAVLPFLDTETLRASKNQDADIKAAFDGLKKDQSFLFNDPTIPRVIGSTSGTDKSADSPNTKANEAFRSFFKS